MYSTSETEILGPKKSVEPFLPHSVHYFAYWTPEGGDVNLSVVQFSFEARLRGYSQNLACRLLATQTLNPINP